MSTSDEGSVRIGDASRIADLIEQGQGRAAVDIAMAFDAGYVRRLFDPARMRDHQDAYYDFYQRWLRAVVTDHYRWLSVAKIVESDLECVFFSREDSWRLRRDIALDSTRRLNTQMRRNLSFFRTLRWAPQQVISRNAAERMAKYAEQIADWHFGTTDMNPHQDPSVDDLARYAAVASGKDLPSELTASDSSAAELDADDSASDERTDKLVPEDLAKIATEGTVDKALEADSSVSDSRDAEESTETKPADDAVAEDSAADVEDVAVGSDDDVDGDEDTALDEIDIDKVPEVEVSDLEVGKDAVANHRERFEQALKSVKNGIAGSADKKSLAADESVIDVRDTVVAPNVDGAADVNGDDNTKVEPGRQSHGDEGSADEKPDDEVVPVIK